MIFVGQLGVSIELDVVSDISAVTHLSIGYRDPMGLRGVFAGVTLGTHYARYITNSIIDLSVAGEWWFNAFVNLGGVWQGPSDPVMIRVHVNPCGS